MGRLISHSLSLTLVITFKNYISIWSWILQTFSYTLFIVLFILEIPTKLQAARQRPRTVVLKLYVFGIHRIHWKNKQKSRNYWPVEFYGFAHIWVAKLLKALQMAICKHSRNSKNWRHISECTQYKGFSSKKCVILIASKLFMDIIGT